MPDETPSERELLELHERALFTHDAHERLLLINEPNGTHRAPCFYLGRSRRGNVWRFRDDVPDALAAELDALCRDEREGDEPTPEPRHREAYRRLLKGRGDTTWSGPAYRFSELLAPSRRVVGIDPENADLLRGGFDSWLGDVADWQPFVAIVVDERAVAICSSVRITSRAHAAGVETLSAFRGRGFARDVVRGWAQRVAALGALPFYSTSWTNEASRAVASSLRLVQYGVDFHVS